MEVYPTWWTLTFCHGKIHHAIFMGKSTITDNSMAIFNSYVKLPDGRFRGFQTKRSWLQWSTESTIYGWSLPWDRWTWCDPSSIPLFHCLFCVENCKNWCVSKADVMIHRIVGGNCIKYVNSCRPSQRYFAVSPAFEPCNSYKLKAY